jgi:hypothetical protein
MATWKKVVVSGSNISQLLNDENYLKASGSGIVSSSAQIFLAGDISGSALDTVIQPGAVDDNKVATNAGIKYTKLDLTNSTILSGSQDQYVTTSSFGEFTASYYIDSASFSASIASLETASGSYSIRVTDLEASASAANDFSASVTSRLTTDEQKYDAYTSSFTTETLVVTGNTAITGTLGVIGNTTFDQDVLIQGDLTVNGTASFVNIEELIVKDKFITLNSGSNTLTDAGFIFQSDAAGTGPSLFIEATGTGAYGRMAMATSVSSSATTAEPAAYVTTTEFGGSDPAAAPIFGDTTTGYGNLWVNSSTGEIFIYS